MPYIICVNRRTYLPTEPGASPMWRDDERGDPTAVATIEEARAFAKDEVCDFHDGTGPEDPNVVATLDLPESGGVIGPLPDGYVIDVQYVNDHELLSRVLAERGNVVTDASRSGVVDAYNQQEA